MPWNYRRYGSVVDPIHKSHLNSLTGDYGCPRQFRYDRDAEADGLGGSEAESVYGHTASGTAVHETIARALTNVDVSARLLRGGGLSADSVERTYREEFAREVDGRELRWRDKDRPDTLHAERVHMVTGVLNDLHKHVARVELVEPGFIVRCGDYWLSGHIDMVYRPRSNPSALAIADWKTGAQSPSDLELDHGWEAGVYSAAVKSGWFIPREAVKVETTPEGWSAARCGDHRFTHPSRYIAERNAIEMALIEVGISTENGMVSPLDVRAFGGFPSEVFHVALKDYVPYQKKGHRRVTRAEELRHYGYAYPRDHAYKAGDRKGPAWLPVKITAHDIPRLESRLRNVVGMIRMGRFIDQVGEKCRRCAWADDCLSSGYAPRGDDRTRLERVLRVLDDDDTADAQALSVD